MNVNQMKAAIDKIVNSLSYEYYLITLVRENKKIFYLTRKDLELIKGLLVELNSINEPIEFIVRTSAFDTILDNYEDIAKSEPNVETNVLQFLRGFSNNIQKLLNQTTPLKYISEYVQKHIVKIDSLIDMVKNHAETSN